MANRGPRIITEACQCGKCGAMAAEEFHGDVVLLLALQESALERC